LAQPKRVASPIQHNGAFLKSQKSALTHDNNANQFLAMRGHLPWPRFLAEESGIPGASAFSHALSKQPRDGEVLPVKDRQPGFYS
jgi:hypothetical protein